MKITVLMAVYDTPPPLLAKAIESILAQSFGDFEFLILDDGSSGLETRNTLAGYAAADSRIALYWEPHRGLTRTLNRGLRLAEGTYLARQDADDFSSSQRLDRQIAAFEANPELVLCGSNAWLHQHDGRRLWSTRLPRTRAQIQEALWQGNPFVHGSTMFRLSAARMLGGYREEFPCSQDYDLFWRLSEWGEVLNLLEPNYHYRYSATAVSARRAVDQLRAHGAARVLALARQRGESEDIEAALEAADRKLDLRRGCRRAALKQADHFLLAGHYRNAFSQYTALVRQEPADWVGWAKLLRGAVFASAPGMREACFS